MSTTTPEHRRIAFFGDDARLDVSAPTTQLVADALDAIGVSFESGRDVLLDRSGREVPPTTLIGDLADGSLLSIVDLGKAAATPPGLRAQATTTRADHRSTWWLLALSALLLAAGALGSLAAGAPLLAGAGRPWVALGLGLGALASAALWIVRSAPRGAGAAALVSTLTLAFAAGTLAVPDAVGATHLAVTIGLLSAAALGSVMAVAARDRVLRAIASTVSVLLVVYGSIWGMTLLLEWPMVAAAALTLGLVVPGIRFLPTVLLPVADGYAINYKHFMSSRWTVRGAIPQEPGAVMMEAIRPTVEVAAARLRTGTIALCLTAPIMALLVLPGFRDGGMMVRIGSIGVIAATVAALFLMPRHGTEPVIMWVSRGVAAVMVIEVAIAGAVSASTVSVTVLAVALLAVGIVAAALIVPLSKGARSLGWSRVGDKVESLSVALALPCALLAANVVELVRGMMSG
ncbi:hypothetical protein [Demequina aurantiaca]|uniref:hypothetical protein n=1 Tax=Demequina aurantiaca TaxID=676200 RepID=UPI003D326C54